MQLGCKKALDYLPKKKMYFLDAGSGSGWAAEVLRKRGYSVVACDIDREKINILKEKGIKALQINLEEKLPFDNNEFDGIICFEVIEHLRNPSMVLDEFYRILKKNGYLVISTPNINRFIFRILFFLGKCPEDFHTTDHLHYYNWDNFKKIIDKGGFLIEKVITEIKFKKLTFTIERPAKFFGWDFVVIARKKEME